MQIRLTDTTVASLKSGEYWDTILPAFGVRVGKRRKTFLVNHERRRKKLGTYPQLSLKDARQKAADMLDGKVARSDTVRDAVEEYLHLIDVRATTLDNYQRYLRKHLVGELGGRKLSEIETRDILKITDAMKEFPSKRHHAYVAFKVFFKWCERRDYLDTSPMQKLDAPVKTKSRSRVLTDDELVRTWKATQQLGTFGSILQLATLTGQRRGELAQIKLSWLQDKCLVKVARTGTRS